MEEASRNSTGGGVAVVIVLLILALIALIGFLVYRLRKQRQEPKTVENAPDQETQSQTPGKKEVKPLVQQKQIDQ